MQTMGKNIGRSAALLPLLLTASVMSAPASASRATDTVHRAVRAKILREASDRSHVEFLTTHALSVSPRLRRVTGRGIFSEAEKRRSVLPIMAHWTFAAAFCQTWAITSAVESADIWTQIVSTGVCKQTDKAHTEDQVSVCAMF